MEGSRAINEAAGQTRELDAVIVGAGFSGLFMLYRLRGMGMKVRAYEAGSGVGGTWFWNRYPGARCDVESYQYSYSFSEELQQEWRWPDRYAVQPNILEYLNHVADRFNLRPDIQLNTRIVSQVFDERTNRWTVTTDTGEIISCRFCIMASGNLSTPKVPDFKGIETFKGAWYHTGLWPAEGVDFTGLRVGLIGTGATGVQMVPKIGPIAKHLYVFQRTANFSVPAGNVPHDDATVQAYKSRYSALRQEALRHSFGMCGFPNPTKSALEATPEERERLYEQKWREGGSISYLSSYTDLLTNLEANETAAEFVRKKIRSIVHDPVTAELLCPKDHPIGSKRLCVDTDYYETYNLPNVTLVDVKTNPIETITPNGLRTTAAEYELDALVFATGFDAMTGALSAIDIRGTGGKPLAEKWAHAPSTYLGVMTAGFPNLFIVTGPGSPSVKSAMVVSIEHHVEWIADCLSYLRKKDIDRIEPDKNAELKWVAHVNEVADRTLYPMADSWYVGANIPGKPRVFMPYVAGVPAYQKKCAEVAAKGYEGFVLAGALAGVN